MREETKELEKMGPLPSYKIAMQPDQLEKLERYTQVIGPFKSQSRTRKLVFW
jgi:hypothetical protein